MKRHKDTYKKTKKVLEQVENSRNSDYLLIYEFYKMHNANLLKVSFGELLLRAEEYGLYPFESITRSRREATKENPELLGTEEVENGRKKNEEEMRKWAKA